MKIVYMGTPDFAVAPLEALIRAGHEVCLVVTQPDRQKGRGREVQMSPVKKCALDHGIPVFQPVKIKEQAAVEELSKYPADIFIVAAFGQLLTEEILKMPPLGCINIHASLLPAYRGAAPIQWAILNGEKESGVTIMQMAKGLDTGDMFTRRVVPIEEKETGDSLHDKLMEAGAALLVETLPGIESGELIPEKQDETLFTYAPKLTKAMGLIDWSREPALIERQIRGLNSWPGAYTCYQEKQLKIWEAELISAGKSGEDASAARLEGGEKADERGIAPGTVKTVGKDFIDVAAGSGTLRIRALQLEGKKRMQVKDFLLGCQVRPGAVFGESQDKEMC